MNWQAHRDTVNEKLDGLAEISNSGNYEQLRKLYPEPAKRNPIVESLHAFTKDFKNSPVNFDEFDEKTDKIKTIYKVNKWKIQLKL